MNTKSVFHGSDIEKICEYYHLKKEEITLTGVFQNLRQQPKERVKERILEIEALLALNRKAQKWMKTEEECEKA